MLFNTQLKEIFQNCKTIAIVGAKDKENTPVDNVGKYLIANGYQIIPIHPVRKSAWGIECHKSLLDLKEAPDVVCLFRASEACAEHAREILSTNWLPKVFWMQLGIISEEAGLLMADADVTVVQDACMKIEHQRLMQS